MSKLNVPVVVFTIVAVAAMVAIATYTPDKARAPYRECEAATFDVERAYDACKRAVEADQSSESGRAAAARLSDLEPEVERLREARRREAEAREAERQRQLHCTGGTWGAYVTTGSLANAPGWKPSTKTTKAECDAEVQRIYTMAMNLGAFPAGTAIPECQCKWGDPRAAAKCREDCNDKWSMCQAREMLEGGFRDCKAKLTGCNAACDR